MLTPSRFTGSRPKSTAAEIGIDDFQASRSPDGRYRTTPLKGLWARMRAGNATEELIQLITHL